MENRVTLDRIVKVEGDSVIITENVETTLNKRQLERSINQIQSKKLRIQQQNERLLTEYCELEIEEQELNELIGQLEKTEPIEVI